MPPAQGLDGWVTLAERDPIQLKRWLDAAGQQKAWLMTEPMDTLIRRARKAGPECEELLIGWDDYEDDPDFMALTERWSEDEMRTIHEVETQYRAAVGRAYGARSWQRRAAPLSDGQRRAARRGRRLSRGVRGCGALRRRGASRRVPRAYRICGALALPVTRKANLTMQHDRAHAARYHGVAG